MVIAHRNPCARFRFRHMVIVCTLSLIFLYLFFLMFEKDDGIEKPESEGEKDSRSLGKSEVVVEKPDVKVIVVWTTIFSLPVGSHVFDECGSYLQVCFSHI